MERWRGILLTNTINNKFFKKIMTILLIAVMSVVVFAACTNDDRDGEDRTQPPTTTAPDGEPAPTDENGGTARILPNLPDYDWEGHIFRILTDRAVDVDDWAMRNVRDIMAKEELTGEPLNDAIYNRNAALEEKYNFTIEQVFSSQTTAFDSLRIAVRAGNDYFDAVSIGGFAPSGIAAQEGFLVDLFDMHYFDFEKPWWNQSVVKDLSIGGKLFFVSGDMTLKNRDAIVVLLFNKQLIANLNLDNPYEFVRGGQWTLSQFSEMARAAASDLNGDGHLRLNDDRFGFLSAWDSMGGDAFIRGAGVRFAGKDSGGSPVLTFGSDRDFKAISAVNDLLSAADFTWSFRTSNDLFLDAGTLTSCN
jgi:ABC-type glycerol-3-phosphate transport system substrate-binding protein